MIKLWNSTEQNFKGNKWILNETKRANITDITNGEFSLDLEYPMKDTKGLSKNIIRGKLITCPVKDERPDQQFRIRKVDKTSSGVIVYAQAKLIADLGSNYIRAMTLTGLTRKQAIQAVLNSALEPHSFVVGNLDINTNNGVTVNIPEGTVLNALIGSENSILSEYGGEFIINNNEFNIVDSRGSNNNFIISYGKNISSIKETTDDTDLATVLIPKSGDYRLPEYKIESPNVANYEKRYFKEVELNLDIWDGTNEQGEDQITIAEAYALMRTVCNNMFLIDKVDQINFNYAIDLIALSKTEEYKEYSILEVSNNGDTVKIKHKILNLDLIGRISKTTYNVLLDKYSKVEVGFTKQDITDIINTTVRSIQFAKQEISLKVENVKKTLSAEIKVTENSILEKVADADSGLQGQINIQANKINAVVEQDGTGMGWELNKSAFKVACVGASGASVTIDENGQTIDDGKFKIKKNGNTVFYVNTSGRCTADGGFRVEDSGTSCSIGSSGITLSNSNGYTSGLYVLSNTTALKMKDDLYIGKGIFVTGLSYFDTNVDIGGILDVGENANITGSLDVGDDLNVDGNFYCRLDGEFLDDLYVDDTLYTESLEVVGGSKNCTQQTENYGLRKINAYETAEYFFGDIGTGTIQNGECLIAIDPIFLECVNTTSDYHVFTQIYNKDGNISEIKRFENYFIVYGAENTEFSWEIKAKRKGFENSRLELSNYSK